MLSFLCCQQSETYQQHTYDPFIIFEKLMVYDALYRRADYCTYGGGDRRAPPRRMRKRCSVAVVSGLSQTNQRELRGASERKSCAGATSLAGVHEERERVSTAGVHEGEF